MSNITIQVYFRESLWHWAMLVYNTNIKVVTQAQNSVVYATISKYFALNIIA